MDRNTIIGILLIGAIFFVFMILKKPQKEEPSKQPVQETTEQTVTGQQNDTTQTDKPGTESTAGQDEITEETGEASQQEGQSNKPDLKKYGIFKNAAVGENNQYVLENEKLEVKVSALGGKITSVRLKEFQTYDSLPLIPFDSAKTYFGLLYKTKAGKPDTVNTTNELFFRSVPSESASDLILRLYEGESDSAYYEKSYVEFRYSISENDYLIHLDIKFVGLKDQFYELPNIKKIRWGTELLKLEKGIDRFSKPTVYYKNLDEVDYLSETKTADAKKLEQAVKWVSFKQRFFSSTIIADETFGQSRVKVVTVKDNDEEYIRYMEATVGYNLPEDKIIPMKFYFGPNKFRLLRRYDLDLERQVPIGWTGGSYYFTGWINRYIIIPVFNFLEGFGWNYGLIILVLTILLKLVLFPIAYRSYKSSAKMRVLRPEVEEVGKKFPKKEDAMKKQQATMALYKQAGVNPMAGCIPMLLQFPILIAMFRFFPSAFELRQQSFLWADDLSSYDSIWDLPFNIPFYGDHVSLFTLLMTVSTIMYTRINNQMMAGSTQQMPGMKVMMYAMPIMFLGLFNNYASGLSYYYLLANVITFAQMFLIRYTIDEDKILKQIETNKKKPVKKSGWQKRLEDAARKRGYKPPSKKK